ncbi:L-lysine 6-transaminase [bacterium (Candidatus Blackallbacteria) CG17_big_fil_post_rev_8_21_14_2_50_48_46]|uniref:L-lysine-epsilon aminotransferase n=1 Tax=bacterium (Candidatus Blackallbacteria) CG17_big_fil_post_rev_8_21_14_2_50_48_46 TaxID=2014261 RepID=A0A2M7G0J7_9BACT|nr:MAG: L-lysine 6-transaminase [bacterium (Candidatus Blackallbacteria) CG18_big_fil_WC_8_21_14_2_50_49_26]PIW15248.1 MAG: L-lysine 6-transaminase [bacterium (Candidatus Blackallbacteria) CG17_big_fil_post_rev_8_21_14_2_50_48_46]PIW45243.1 MAG: L-lysine 6-transaminase [bacterium (Candidatus Blackallbacteria) CG13_big_fil_rev_8_21_14_2_50_49_14]
MQITVDNAFEVLEQHILRDGMNFILDFDKSHGNYLHDAKTGTEFLDFFSFFASLPIGFNHPKMKDAAYQEKLLKVAQIKPSNSDIYTLEMAEFIETFGRLAGDDEFKHFFFISGGALAVENALKAAFDWKVRKNLAQGKGEKGTQIMHFREAFHGRSGYTMSLTNTDPNKIMYFPKFDWPRISNPKCIYPMNEANTARVIASEEQALAEIHAAIAQNPDDIAAMIIEPIQSEGGDNHFRPEFLKALRQICDEHEIILIFDEVQTGFGLTGKMWAYEHYPEAHPDIVVFGKKFQICGIMANERLNEVDSVFKVSSRINSTFGGNLVDMVRCARYLEVVAEEHLIENAAEVGDYILGQLQGLQNEFASMTNARGRGLLLAFDCPSKAYRNQLIDVLFEHQMLALSSGEQSVRFRPGLAMNKSDADKGLEILASCIKQMEKQAVTV